MIKFDTDTLTFSIVAKDTGDFVISLDNYLLDDGDNVYFTVNDELEKANPRIQKKISVFENNKAIIHLSSVDTDIPVGNYYYDVEVNTADGRVDTVLGPAKFKVLGGVKF